MSNTITFKASALPVIFTRFNVNEVKLIIMIAYYLSQTNKIVFVNNAYNREWLANHGFRRSSKRISYLLSSLVDKKALKPQAPNVFSINSNIIDKIN